MDKNRKLKSMSGEITAFLSMILLLVLSLVGTTLESAKVNVGNSYGNRSLQNALDSLFTEYCLPVWEDYHLFLLEGATTVEEDKAYITKVLQDYMEYTLMPEKGELSLLEKAETVVKLDLLGMEIEKLEVMDIIRAEDYDRELLLHEILEYSKYQVDESVFADGQMRIESLKEVDGCKKVIEKQLEAEQKMAEVNLAVLEFLSAVEGIGVGKTGILIQRNGLLQREKYFVKKFCPSAITKGNVGISHDTVWQSLKGSYCNPVSMLENIEMEAAGILSQLELMEAQAAAKAAGESSGSGEDATGQGKEILIVINYSHLYQLKGELLKEAKGILKHTEKAQKLLRDIKEKQFVFKQQAKELEVVYKEQEAKLSEQSKKVFLEEIEGLKNFISLESKEETSMIGTILEMEETLESNRKRLENLIDFCNYSVGNSTAEIRNYLEILQTAKEDICNYKITSLQFDYSSLIIEKDVENPIAAFEKVYKNNLLELVVKEPGQISKKVKKKQTRQVKGSMMEWENLQQLPNEQVQQILTGVYIEQHFSCYMDSLVLSNEESVAAEDVETVLTYEQEYILAGKLSDKENLEETLHKMIFTRGLLNYIYLLTDKEKCDMAYRTAAALVGYTCMEPLVQLTKNSILLVWAVEEAMVDVAALLQGKAIPVMKSETDFYMGYEELLLLNRDLIQCKAEEVPLMKEKLALNYQEYLQLFLMFYSKEVKMARLAELIEDNIQIRYDENFQLDRCIYGTTVSTVFRMEEKFLKFPFVQKILTTSGEGFMIHRSQSYCY